MRKSVIVFIFSVLPYCVYSQCQNIKPIGNNEYIIDEACLYEHVQAIIEKDSCQFRELKHIELENAQNIQLKEKDKKLDKTTKKARRRGIVVLIETFIIALGIVIAV